MAAHAISRDKLIRLIGLPGGPNIIDVRTGPAFDAEPRLIPGAIRRDPDRLAEWMPGLGGGGAVLVCVEGGSLSAGVAARLRAEGIPAEKLEGGIKGWLADGLPALDTKALPPVDAQGRTVWITRARPKVDRIACPWLIRRFVDSGAAFLFVPPPEVEAVAERLGATPFDVEGVRWSHQGELCTFDTMVDGFGLGEVAGLARLATIVRGADTDRPEIAPQAAGLLAASLGLSRMHADDHQQLEAGMSLYDAYYRWCRDAVDETHDWVSHQPRARVSA